MIRFHRLRRESGQSLAELAIVLPVLLAILVAIFEFGRAWNVRQVVTNVAREGARLAVVPSSDASSVRTTIENGLQAAALDPAAGTVTIDMGEGTGTASTILVSYPYTFTFLGPIVSLLNSDEEIPSGTINLTTSVAMRNE